MATQYTAGLAQGQKLTADIMNQIGATWETWTPTVTQSGTLTATNQFSRYARINKIVIAQTYLTITSTGVAGNDVYVTLPINGRNTSAVLGSGFVYDSSAVTLWTVVAAQPNASQIILYTSPNGTGGALGSNPNVALANGDQIRLSLCYEVN